MHILSWLAVDSAAGIVQRQAELRTAIDAIVADLEGVDSEVSA